MLTTSSVPSLPANLRWRLRGQQCLVVGASFDVLRRVVRQAIRLHRRCRVDFLTVFGLYLRREAELRNGRHT